MKTLHVFKISEDSKKFDIVELIYDELEEIYIVRWKWTTSNQTIQSSFKDYADAIQRYKERKNFAKMCN